MVCEKIINVVNINMNKNICDNKIDLFTDENLSTMFQSFYKNFCGEKKIIVNETPNRQKIKFILDNEKKIKNLGFDKVIEDCMIYKKNLKNYSSLMVEYKDNKNIRMKMNPTKNSTTMTKKLRNFIYDNVVDLDMKNSQVNIFINLINIFKLGDYPILNKVYEDKNKFLEDNELNKEDMISILNGGFINKTTESKSLCNEMECLFNKFINLDIFKNLLKSCKNSLYYKSKNGDTGTLKNSFISWVYQSIEVKILLLTYEFLKSKNYEISSLEYDGLKVKNNFNECEALNNFIKEKSGLNIEFLIKPMDINEKLKIIYDDFVEKELEDLVFDSSTFIIEYKDLEEGFLFVAKKLIPILQDKIKYCLKEWYGVKNNLWLLLNPINIISEALQKGFNNYRDTTLKYIKENNEMLDPEDKKYLLNSIKLGKNKIDSSSFLKHITDSLTELLRDDKFKYSLNKNSYCITFENGIYDIKKKKFEKNIEPTDFISKTLNFEYENYDEYSTTKKKEFDENKKFIKEELKKVCNYDDSHLNYIMTLIGYMMCGDPSKHQIFTFMLGQGGNGKTFLVNLLHKIMGCYVEDCESKVLEDGFEKQHKFYGKFGLNRIVYFNEMRKNKKISSGVMKTLADGKSLNFEVLFGTEMTIDMMAKPILVCNPPLEFDSDMDGGVSRRYTHLQHNSHFSEKYTEDDFKNKKFIADESISNKIINEYYKEFVSLIIDYMIKFNENGIPKQPELFKSETDDIKENNDEFGTFINDNYKKTDNPKDKISKTDIQEFYQEIFNKKIDNKNIREGMKKLNFTYDKNLTFGAGKGRGGFKYIKKIEFEFENFINDNYKKTDNEKDKISKDDIQNFYKNVYNKEIKDHDIKEEMKKLKFTCDKNLTFKYIKKIENDTGNEDINKCIIDSDSSDSDSSDSDSYSD